MGSFRWICLLTTKPWALWLISPFSSTGTGESNIRLFWRSLQGFALLSVVSSPIANQFGGLPGRHSIHLYHSVSGSIQGHADILKRLKPVHVNWGLCLENYCLFSKADCCNTFYLDLWLMQGQQKDIFLCMYRFIEWCFVTQISSHNARLLWVVAMDLLGWLVGYLPRQKCTYLSLCDVLVPRRSLYQ